MDEQKKIPPIQPQNAGSIIREIERPVSDYATEKTPNIEGVENFVKNEEKVLPPTNPQDQYQVKDSAQFTPIPSQPSSSLVLPQEKVKKLQSEAKTFPPTEAERWRREEQIREELKAA